MPSKKPRNYPKYTSLFQIQVSNPTIPSLVLLDVSTRSEVSILKNRNSLHHLPVLPSVVARWAVLANMESRLAVLQERCVRQSERQEISLSGNSLLTLGSKIPSHCADAQPIWVVDFHTIWVQCEATGLLGLYWLTSFAQLFKPFATVPRLPVPA